jgi:hypothetical protein
VDDDFDTVEGLAAQEVEYQRTAAAATKECSAEYGMKRCSYGMFSTRAVVLAAWSFFFSRESSERQEHG